MKLRDYLDTLTLSGLINFGKKEFGLQHLNKDIKRTSITEQIIEADRRNRAAAGKGSVKRKVNYSRDGISFKSKKDLDDYLLNIAKETGTLSAAEKESFTSNERRKLAKLKIAQKEIINDLESQGCLLYLLSKNELQEYGRNIGIELSLEDDEYDLIYQIESAEGEMDGVTSQDDKSFFRSEKARTKKYRNAHLNKVKYSENAKRRLDELKMAQEKVREDLKLIEHQIEIKRQRKEALELEKSIQKHRAKAEATDKAVAANVKREAARKAKDSLKKRFY